MMRSAKARDWAEEAYLEREAARQETARLHRYVASKVKALDPVSAEAWRWATWMA